MATFAAAGSLAQAEVPIEYPDGTPIENLVRAQHQDEDLVPIPEGFHNQHGSLFGTARPPEQNVATPAEFVIAAADIRDEEPSGPMQRALIKASDLAPGEQLRVTFLLHSMGRDNLAESVYGLDKEEKRNFAFNLEALHRFEVDSFSAFAATVGCSYQGARILTAAVDFDCPASVLGELVLHPSVEDLTADSSMFVAGVDSPSWTGWDVTNDLGIWANYITNGNKYEGNTGNRDTESNPVIIAVGDEKNLHEHVGYSDYPNNPATRIKYRHSCTSSPTCDDSLGWNTSATQTHGDRVMSLAIGNVMQGQHPSLTYNQRRQRSWASPESEGAYYVLGDNPNSNVVATRMAAALEHARRNYVDIFIFSYHSNKNCDADEDEGFLNATLRTVTNAGMLVVMAAGNNYWEFEGCSMVYPAYRPEVLSVGSLDSENHNAPLAGLVRTNGGDGQSSSYGGIATTVAISGGGSMDVADTRLGVMAPGRVRNTYGPGTTDYADFSTTSDPAYGENSGSSFAAPLVAGSLANLIDYSVDEAFPWDAHNPRQIKTLALLYADRYLGDTSAVYKTIEGVTAMAGSGRFRALDPLNGWGTNCYPPPNALATHDIVVGQVTLTSTAVDKYIYIPRTSACAKQVKAVAFYEEEGVIGTSNIDLKLQFKGYSTWYNWLLDDSGESTKMVQSPMGGTWDLRIVLDAKALTGVPATRTVYYAVTWHTLNATHL